MRVRISKINDLAEGVSRPELCCSNNLHPFSFSVFLLSYFSMKKVSKKAVMRGNMLALLMYILRFVFHWNISDIKRLSIGTIYRAVFIAVFQARGWVHLNQQYNLVFKWNECQMFYEEARRIYRNVFPDSGTCPLFSPWEGNCVLPGVAGRAVYLSPLLSSLLPPTQQPQKLYPTPRRRSTWFCLQRRGSRILGGNPD